MINPILKQASYLFCLIAICQSFLPAQECLEVRVDFEGEQVSNFPAPYSFQSITNGDILLATNTRQIDNSRLIHLFDSDLSLLSSQQYAVERDGTIADIQPMASGGYLGVINTPFFQNALSTYSIFLVEGASSPDNNIIYTSDPASAGPMEVSNILSVEDSILFISGTRFGEFGVVADSTFLEKQVNNETVWRHINRGGVLLGLDGDADSLNLLVARDNAVETVTISGETGETGSSYFSSLAGHRFAPLIFRNVESNTTYLAKFTDTYELASYSSTGTDWTYLKEQTLTSDWIDRILDVQFDDDGFIYVNGIFYNEENGSGILLTKLSPQGELIWEQRYDNEGELSTAASYSVINGGIIYLSARKTSPTGAWNQHVLAFSLEDGQLLKECSLIEEDDHRFSTRAISFFDGKVYTFGPYNDRVEAVLSLRSFDFSDLTSSNEETAPLIYFKVYPNPADARGQLTVELPVLHQLSRIRVTSVNGQQVASYPLHDNQLKLKINNLSPGAYVLSVHDKAGGVTGRQQVVIQ